MQHPTSPQERFLSYINMDGPIPEHRPGLGPCWTWGASFDQDGYAKIGITISVGKYMTARAARKSWEWFYGPIGKELLVLHKCDNPSCVNPIHLFLGNSKSNVMDMHDKGRFPRQDGDFNFAAKITRKIAEEIRVLYASGNFTQLEIANKFKISRENVGHVVRGNTWN
jgi:predicted XRE-type DNA-binding protein